ncbi:MAG: ACT domain-containing protein, partial [Candidatus Poribacteria bacterium]
ISKYDVNISKSIVSVDDPANVIQHFWINVTDVKQLQRVMSAIMRVKSVRNVERKGIKGL